MGVLRLSSGCFRLVVLFLPLLKGEAAPWRLRALLVSQIPIILMLAIMLPFFLLPPFAATGVLILGLLIQSLACVELLLCAK